MRVALLSDDSLPKGTRGHAKMIHELAAEFSRNGDVPVVITPGTPNQPASLIIDHFDGVEYWRFRSGYTRGVGMVRRMLLPFNIFCAFVKKI